MAKKRTKYGARKVKCDGYTFDSQMEHFRYLELKLMLGSGTISDLSVHPKFMLQAGFTYGGKRIRPICYYADFMYTEDGRTIVEDVKGKATAVWKLKWKLAMYQNPSLDWRAVDKYGVEI